MSLLSSRRFHSFNTYIFLFLRFILIQSKQEAPQQQQQQQQQQSAGGRPRPGVQRPNGASPPTNQRPLVNKKPLRPAPTTTTVRTTEAAEEYEYEYEESVEISTTTTTTTTTPAPPRPKKKILRKLTSTTTTTTTTTPKPADEDYYEYEDEEASTSVAPEERSPAAQPPRQGKLDNVQPLAPSSAGIVTEPKPGAQQQQQQEAVTTASRLQSGTTAEPELPSKPNPSLFIRQPPNQRFPGPPKLKTTTESSRADADAGEFVDDGDEAFEEEEEEEEVPRRRRPGSRAGNLRSRPGQGNANGAPNQSAARRTGIRQRPQNFFAEDIESRPSVNNNQRRAGGRQVQVKIHKDGQLGKKLSDQ